MKVYLIGMPGAGKSTIGNQLARALDLPFLDLDREIEHREGRTIPEIFSQSGEDHFRLIESMTLREFAGNGTSFVMATGGGAPCFYDNMEALNASGLTVYLKVTLNTLIERLRNSKGRPLLEADQDLRLRLGQLLETRKGIYENARLIVTEPDVQKVVREIQRTGINR